MAVRLGYSSGYNGAQKPFGVRLIPAYMESDLCVEATNVTDSSSYALCYSHTDISLPTESLNFLGECWALVVQVLWCFVVGLGVCVGMVACQILILPW